MHEHITELLQLTVNYAGRIDTLSYDELQNYLVKREQIVSFLLHSEITEDMKTAYREQIREALSYDTLFLGKMEQLKNQASVELSRLALAKKQKSLYEVNQRPDGVYFDKRK
jgi:hypothetical protein